MPATEEIRPSTRSDIPAIELLLKECFPNRKVVVPDVESLLYKHDGAIIGCIFYRIAAGECEVIDVCVAAESRRGGVATRLLTEVFQCARKVGVAQVFLEVESQNEPAISLYKKHGFSEIGLRKNYYAYVDGSAKDAVIMTKELQK